MMRTHYEAPPKPIRKTDYAGRAGQVRQHLNGMIHQDKMPHAGQFQHMGSVAMLADHLDDMHYGESHKVLTELKEVMDYLAHFEKLGHSIFFHFAEEELNHARTLAAAISDRHDKLRANHFVECAAEYMESLRPKLRSGGSSMAPTQGGVNL